MIHLDGSAGEGGGQVLRTALSLSLVTGEPFALANVRAGRPKPGLQRQHLTSVLAAAEIAEATVDGAELGSRQLVFRPDRVRAGDYRFAIGTAGSTTLVLQTVLPALLTADAPSTVEVRGGTHNPFAPPFEFLDRTFAKALRLFGGDVDLRLYRHGFAPAGGGAVSASIRPSRLSAVELLTRETPQPGVATVVQSQLPKAVAERQLAVVKRRLGAAIGSDCVLEVDAAGPGNVLLLEFAHARFAEIVSAPGERSSSAEAVAERACLEALEYLASEAPVGEHLADQLLLPMAMAGGGAFRTVTPSLHTRTNAEVVARFLPVAFAFREERRKDGGVDWIVSATAR